jgi:enterochelin esterase-like enzyme
VTGRELRVWLPPGYADRANATRVYPVLYLMDGQNIFEQAPGTPAEWRADETAAELIAARTVEPFIIVGVPHSERWRMAEYCPLSGVQGVPACGEAFVDWMLAEVKPRVERAFRVKPGPEGSAIGGASMGGLISLYAATRHPDVFGSVLIESPSMVLGQRDTVKELLTDAKGWPARVYIGIGDREVTQGENAADVNTKLVEAVRAVDAAAGTAAVQHLLVVEPGATHDEMAWARRLGPALRFLYSPEKK